nr:GLPGLI family protein [Pedobacter sp. ASV28]
MKRSLTILAFLLISICVFAQKAEMAIAKVKYNLIHIRDTNNRSKPYTEEMLLLIGKNASMFTSNLKVTQNINFRKQVNEQVRNNGGSLDGLHIDGSKRKRTIGEDFYFFNTENKLYTLEPMGTNYLTEEDIPKIGWNIIKDTLSISGIKCQKRWPILRGENGSPGLHQTCLSKMVPGS